jgi:hypothetical protein
MSVTVYLSTWHSISWKTWFFSGTAVRTSDLENCTFLGYYTVSSGNFTAICHVITQKSADLICFMATLDLAGGNSPSLFQSDSFPVTGLLLNHISSMKVYIHSYKNVYLIILESELTTPMGYVTIWKYLAHRIFKTFFSFR